ncbi:hypothetical protein GS421_14655 [Rhodococcus hoagii]|nr:hypothetical protein [Prescottella equi]
MSGGALTGRTLLQGAVGLAAADGIAGSSTSRGPGTSRANTHGTYGWVTCHHRRGPVAVSHNTGSFDGNPVSPRNRDVPSWSSLARRS